MEGDGFSKFLFFNKGASPELRNRLSNPMLGIPSISIGFYVKIQSNKRKSDCRQRSSLRIN
jgi:hypothetical protein